MVWSHLEPMKSLVGGGGWQTKFNVSSRLRVKVTVTEYEPERAWESLWEPERAWERESLRESLREILRESLRESLRKSLRETWAWAWQKQNRTATHFITKHLILLCRGYNGNMFLKLSSYSNQRMRSSRQGELILFCFYFVFSKACAIWLIFWSVCAAKF